MQPTRQKSVAANPSPFPVPVGSPPWTMKSLMILHEREAASIRASAARQKERTRI